ncbi:hypothetical protein CC85DRAFT_239698 [Cutaneotrichosporon oleaginosum]|uniref:SGNH hydrolase-type esterase domain-containing protein n=1 Tax=Cutaneotrichosporon oleaginosum TaxID=879819 RepID=A0A0J1BD43_9TREE|nr:uncharacterized protein CC85DRAFT_239698 [Cutaneotrichosporon oleaginosum]KLT45969.1 hypothetical protein CC85DRAFT_239698 [Cutaneotrichosporon oleaginosum]TXT06664.1 hypothetical protein COLE_05995 [Cutaneotrichosporon oleaginosum]
MPGTNATGYIHRLLGAKDTVDQAAIRAWEIARATQHTGTGARVHRLLEKAKRGEPFTVAAIGGSVSKGRGLVNPSEDDHVRPPPDAGMGASTLYSPENLHVLVFEWLNSTFPHPGNTFVNGAQGGVGSGYFAWCFKEHIAPAPDLVLIELGINDLLSLDIVPKYEHLVRSVLELDSAPAIINLETFTTLFPSLVSSSALHADVLAYYDVPSLSIRDILLPRILADPHTQLPRWFRTGGDVRLGDDKVREWGGVPVDLMHISAKGHALAAGLIINYLSQQLSIVSPGGLLGRLGAKRLRAAQRVYDVPSTRLTASFNPADMPGRRPPVCRSTNSPRLHAAISGIESDEEGAQGIQFATNSGWHPWAWDEKRYMIAREPGSLATFDFVTAETEAVETHDEEPLDDPIAEYEPHPERTEQRRSIERKARPETVVDRREAAKQRERASARARARKKRPRSDATGTVAVGYQRSAHYGLGSVWCWVDSDRAGGVRLDGYWEIKERNMGIVDTVATGLAPGPHRLSCELLPDTRDPQGRKEFRLFAIMHD